MRVFGNWPGRRDTLGPRSGHICGRVRRLLSASAVQNALEKFDPFKGYLVERVRAAAPDRIPVTVLHREIVTRGYDWGLTRLKQFLRGLVPAPVSDPVVRFETAPGHQMQADWTTVGRGGDKLKVFIATLG